MGRRPGLPENDRQRAIGMVDAGMSIADVTVQFNVHRSTVWRLINRYRQTGTARDRPRSGRPKKLTPREERYLRFTSTRDKFLPATRIVHHLRATTGIRVSAQTVRNRLDRLGIHARRPHKGMELTPHHQHQRLIWTNRHLRWLNRDWRTVMFTDESRFTLKFADGRIRVWRRKNERYHASTVMQKDMFGGGSLMVWGGIHYGGKTNLMIVRGTLNARRYCDNILTPVVLPFYVQRNHNGFHFQQDNARPHTARLTMNLLQTNNINVLEWPSRSPDLNPIEHVWDLLNRCIRTNQRDFQNIQELENALIRE